VGDVLDATEAAIKAATHLTDMDAGAVEALRALAGKIDAWDLIVEYAMDDLAGEPKGARPKVPQNDNVSVPTYLKFCESLGLTPAGRSRLTEKKPEGQGGSTIGDLQAQARKRRRTA
jgi:hypothetical protein